MTSPTRKTLAALRASYGFCVVKGDHYRPEVVTTASATWYRDDEASGDGAWFRTGPEWVGNGEWLDGEGV